MADQIVPYLISKSPSEVIVHLHHLSSLHAWHSPPTPTPFSHALIRTHARARQAKMKDDFPEVARPEGEPLLLILDRRVDPVTPLLTQWTYQVSAI